jgi:hypothetical protein
VGRLVASYYKDPANAVNEARAELERAKASMATQKAAAPPAA